MFHRACAAAIDRVEVHFHVVGNVTADHRPLQEMDVVEPVCDPRRIVQVLQGRVAIGLTVGFHDAYRGTSRAEMHPRAAQVQIMRGVAGAKREVARGLGQRVLDHGARKPHPPVLSENGTDRHHGVNPALRCIGKADVLKRLQSGEVNALHTGIGQGLVLSATQAGANGAQMVGQGGGTRGATRGTTAGARNNATKGGIVVHDVTGKRSRTAGYRGARLRGGHVLRVRDSHRLCD